MDAESLLDNIANWLTGTKNEERNLLFIDPYGYKTIHKDTLEKLMRNGKTEIILFLPVSFMHRFKDYALDPEASESVTPLRKFTEDFFPEGHPMRNGDEEMNVHDYINYLKEAFSYGGKYYTASYQIEREKGKFFALFFMTSNLLGFEKILEVKWKLDEDDGNGFVLAKATPYVQTSLFEDVFAEEKREQHSKELRKYIEDYLHTSRNNGEMYEFVMRKGYMKTHAVGVLKQMQDEGRLEYSSGFKVTIHEDALAEPKKWRKPRTIFVCSMSDLFHKDVPFEFVDKVMQVIRETPQHRYQLLTKRAERMEEYFKTREVPKNVWLGVTVEVKTSKNRIDALRTIENAPIRFLSCEPLLEDLGILDLTGIDWIIVGGESGTQAQPMKEDWVLNIKNQCDKANKAFFFKQWGTWGSDGVKRDKHKNGKQLRGEICQEMPEDGNR